MFNKLKSWMSAHRFLSVVGVVIIVAAGWWARSHFSTAASTVRYTYSQVQRGTLTSSISGSGQVSVSQNVSLQPKASGQVLSISVVKGQFVKAGTVIAQIDSRDASRSVRDAELNLESAQLSLAKLKNPPEALALLQAQNAVAQSERDLVDLKKPPETLALLQAQNALTSAQEAKTNAVDAIEKAYDDSYSKVTDTFLDLPTVMSGLDDMFFDNTIQNGFANVDWYANQVLSDQDKVQEYRKIFTTSFAEAKKVYETNADLYKKTPQNSDNATIENLTNKTNDTVKVVAAAIRNANNYVDFVEANLKAHGVTPPSVIGSNQTTIDTYTVTVNTDATAMLDAQSNILDKKQANEASDRAITEKQESLDKLKNGADAIDVARAEESLAEKKESLKKLRAGPTDLDLRSAELTIAQRENSLADAREKLSDYTVRAPFDGVIADIAVKKGDTASASTALATLITTDKIAELQLNEVDVARVKVGQKTTLTFDAVPDLNLTGAVAEVDTIGTVTQGVVSYMVKITFDTQDERIKPSMSVVAAIITDVKTDVLIVPNSAVKSQGDGSYVDVQNTTDPSGTPERKPVTIGLQNDDSTEIISGVNEGDSVVTATITAQAAATQSASAAGGVRIPGLGGGGGSGAAGFGGATRGR